MAGKKTDPSRMWARVKGGKGGAQLRPIGVIRSILKTRREAPMQGSEGAPDSWLEVIRSRHEALTGSWSATTSSL